MRGPLTWDRSKLLAPIAALVVGLVVPTSAKADTPAIQQLMENARYWQKRGRADRAVEAYNKVLRANPRHAGALSALGHYYARKGNKRAALKMLKRLRSVHPNSSKVTKLERAITIGGSYEKIVAEARDLVKQRKFDAAVAKYREAFGSKPPRDMALEYYQTLGGSKNGWEPAEQGLRALHKASPRKTRYRLALAKHLTYREHTRREGIRMLSEMAQHSKARKQARRAWRQALIWLHVGQADIPRLEKYLAVVGDDAEIRRRLTDWNKTVTVRQTVAVQQKINYRDRRHSEIFDLINKGQVDEADSKLTVIERKHGHDATCLLARGIIHMRREEFGKAVEILEKAKAKAPKRSDEWGKPLAASKFWKVVKDAETARLAGQFDKAEELLNEALKMTAENPQFAHLQLAHLNAAKGEFVKAEEMYRSVLKTDANNAEATRGLVMVFIGTQQIEEAVALNKRLMKLDRSKAFDEKKLEAEVLRARANKARANKELSDAREMLKRASQLDPTNKWVLLDLAYTLNEMRLHSESRKTVDRLLAMDGKLMPAKLLKAQLLADSGQFRRAMEYLDQVSAGDLSSDALEMKEHLEIQLQAKKAVSDAQLGKMMIAERALHELTLKTKGKPKLAGHVALAWADVGNYDQAQRMLMEVLIQEPDNEVDLRLQLAAIQLRGNMDAEFATTVNQLIHSEAKLTARQMTDLSQLRVAHAVRTADKLREAGENKRAFQYLRPLLSEHRSNADLYSALGRLFLSSGEPQEARTVFMRVLKHNPKSLDARDGAVAASLAMHERDEARNLVLQGLAQSPRSPRMHLIAGRFYATVGEDDNAMNVLEQGIMLADGSPEGRAKGRSLLRKRNKAPRIGDGASTDQIVALAQASFVGESTDDAANDMQVASGIHAELRAEVDNISKRYNTEIGADLGFRHRFGEAGLSQLSEFSLPVWASVPLGYRGRIIFSAMPIYLTAGEAVLTEDGAWTRLGTGALQAGAAPDESVAQSASGAALGIAYNYKGFSIGIGSTPLGFPLSTVTAGLSYKQQFGSFGLSLTADRKPMTDSLLSYAGQTDPVTGEVWGGVMHNKGRIDLAYISDDMTMYLFGGGSYVQGTFVPDNVYAVGGLGALWSVARWDGNQLITGLNASVLSYKENLRYFSLGHAGYFSPQLFAHVGVPFRWSASSGRLSYEVKGEPGLNYFEEDNPDYFPHDQARQSALAFITDEEGEPQPAAYAANESSFGFALDASARISYQIMPNLVLGITAKYHTAEDYQEFVGMGNIRFQFTKRKSQPITTGPSISDMDIRGLE